MTPGHLAVPIVWLPLLLSPEILRVGDGPDEPFKHVTVMITSAGYAPAELAVRHGDVVRFVQQHALAHNIEFHRAPQGAGFASSYEAPPGAIEVLLPTTPTARVGPMLIGIGSAYEIRIGEEMPSGVYVFGCSRHSKWRGRLVVDGPGAGP